MTLDQLGDAINSLNQAPDAAAAANVLRQYPDLITPAVDAQLTQVIQIFWDQKNLNQVTLFTAVRGLLRRCKTKNSLADQPGWPLDKNRPLAYLLGLTEADDLAERIKWGRLTLRDLDAGTEPELYGMAQFRLGRCFVQKTLAGDETALEPGKEYLATAVRILTPVKDGHSRNLTGLAHLNLAILYRTQKGDRRNNELALNHARQAGNLLDENSPDRINSLIILGNAYLDRVLEERLHNIEQSIHHFEQALSLSYYPDAIMPPHEIEHNLAVAYRLRLKGHKADNYDMALAYAEQALSKINRAEFAKDWAKTSAEKAVILAHRQRGSRSENLEEAIELTRQVLTYYRQDTHPRQWSLIRLRLGNLYCDRLEGNRRKNHRLAIEQFTAVQQARNPITDPFGWAEAVNNLGTAYMGLCRQAHDAHYRQAMACFQEALEKYGPDKMPDRARRTAVNQGNLAFHYQQWAEALAAYQTALEAGNILYEASGTQAGRQSELAENAGLAAKAAYCLLHLDQPQPDKAFQQLEQGKTRLLVEALTLREADLAQLPAATAQAVKELRQQIKELEAESHLPLETALRRDDLELGSLLVQKRHALRHLAAEIRQTQPDFLTRQPAAIDFADLIPVNGAVVAPLITEQGSAAFVIPHGAKTVTAEHVVPLPQCRGGVLDGLLKEWISAYLQRWEEPGSWRTAVTAVTEKLWPILIQPIAETLTHFQCREVVFIPQGGLQLLPLHAAWYGDNGRKHYFIDDFVIRYAPSLSVLALAQKQLAYCAGQQALIAGIDQYKSRSNLANAVNEARQIAQTFNTDPLCDEEVTRQAILTNVSDKNYLHLACHGSFNWDDALESALYLTNDETLTLNDVMTKLDLKTMRLVTLSACETGITELSHLPDEFIGLPAGFMQAGAPGVISSLWSVEDKSTFLLMSAFYTYHFKKRLPPATALKKAQAQLRQEYPQYETPYFWAAFTFYGN